MQRGRALLAGIAVTAAALVGAVSASAHVQVLPTAAAPGDAVEFTVLVPGERNPSYTTKVQLKVPAGVLPFSYAETPGWTRKLVLGSNKAVSEIVWTGRSAPDGYVKFTFLAGTPDRTGTIAWRALQTYDDGTIVRWIGAPDSDLPAATTRITRDAAAQGAGGEIVATASSPKVVATTAGDQPDWITRGAAIAALVIALVALAVALLGRRSRRSAGADSDAW